MKLNKYFLTLLMAFTAILPSWASPLEDAARAYGNGDYEKAAELYLQVMENDGVSASLLFNLGNSYGQMGSDDKAILCYERARKLDPRNEEINTNLEYFTRKVADANKLAAKGKSVNLDTDTENFLSKIYRVIAIDNRSNSWAVFAVISFLLFLAFLALYMCTPNVLARKTGFFSGLTFLGFTVVFLIFSLMAAHEYKSRDEAVLIGVTAELLDSADENAHSVSTPFNKGTKFRIIETKTDRNGKEWAKVRYNGANSGWIKKEHLEVI